MSAKGKRSRVVKIRQKPPSWRTFAREITPPATMTLQDIYEEERQESEHRRVQYVRNKLCGLFIKQEDCLPTPARLVPRLRTTPPVPEPRDGAPGCGQPYMSNAPGDEINGLRDTAADQRNVPNDSRTAWLLQRQLSRLMASQFYANTLSLKPNSSATPVASPSYQLNDAQLPSQLSTSYQANDGQLSMNNDGFNVSGDHGFFEMSHGSGALAASSDDSSGHVNQPTAFL